MRPPRSTQRPRVESVPPPSGRPAVRPNEGAPGLDLTTEQQQRIDSLFEQLPTLGLYDLLGVPHSADKKAIKRAYTERVVELHPDRFFRKHLGAFKPKMEAIIARMTEAHDVLCSPEHRERYDAALRSKRASLVDAMLAEAEEEIRAQAAERDVVRVERSVRVESTPPPSSRSAERREATPDELHARRQALASRLSSGRLTPGARFKPVGAPPTSGAKPTAPTPVAAFRPNLPTPAAAFAAPSFTSIEAMIARLRELHSRHRNRPLEGADRALYDMLREDFARMFVAAQRLTLRDGQTYRQALRVTCSLKLELSLGGRAHKTMTLDLSTGGLGALLGVMVTANERCDFAIDLGADPIRGKARVVSCARHGTSGSAFRVSVSFEPLEAPAAERLDMLVLDQALSHLKM